MMAANNYTHSSNDKEGNNSDTALSGSWGVPAVSHAVTGFLRRFATEANAKSDNSMTPDESYYGASNAASSPRIRKASPFQPPPLYQITLHGYHPTTQDSAKLLSKSLAEEIRLLIPARLQLCEEWNLVYSLEEDGVSLGTLYKKCSTLCGRRNGFVLVVRDGKGDLFGAYLNEAPRVEPHFFGNGECFLWRSSFVPCLTPKLWQSSSKSNDTAGQLLSPEIPEQTNSNSYRNSQNIRFKAFPYSGINDYLMLCDTGYLSFGGGDGRYGLWLDDTFEHGISSNCLTFGNEPLSDEGEKFDVMGVEVWCIGHLP
ncbi:unnamed protein product [Blumeria hordei]|uniref:Oxidation resistance protein 1 n=1 Tax=Blumeria hordei TaxID=2867405 RepID=A0A383UVX8_BLUHO|nr:unnamed protein product [Blumeria hordei]